MLYLYQIVNEHIATSHRSNILFVGKKRTSIQLHCRVMRWYPCHDDFDFWGWEMSMLLRILVNIDKDLMNMFGLLEFIP